MSCFVYEEVLLSAEYELWDIERQIVGKYWKYYMMPSFKKSHVSTSLILAHTNDSKTKKNKVLLIPILMFLMPFITEDSSICGDNFKYEI